MLENILTESVALPELSDVLAFKGVYALCTTNREGRVLKATHFCCVLIGGPHPIWGCWLSNGKFQRFFSFRSQIEAAYPKLVWRRKMATWTMSDMTDKSVSTRRAELEQRYGRRVPSAE